jgi:hypothetical protein
MYRGGSCHHKYPICDTLEGSLRIDARVGNVGFSCEQPHVSDKDFSWA